MPSWIARRPFRSTTTRRSRRSSSSRTTRSGTVSTTSRSCAPRSPEFDLFHFTRPGGPPGNTARRRRMARTPRQFRWTSLVVLTLAFIGALPTLAAQERPATGALAGVVVSEEGAALSAASIRLARTDGAESYTATSDADGRFRVASLVPGLYRVTARQIGFREAELPLLRIAAG